MQIDRPIIALLIFLSLFSCFSYAEDENDAAIGLASAMAELSKVVESSETADTSQIKALRDKIKAANMEFVDCLEERWGVLQGPSLGKTLNRRHERFINKQKENIERLIQLIDRGDIDELREFMKGLRREERILPEVSEARVVKPPKAPHYRDSIIKPACKSTGIRPTKDDLLTEEMDFSIRTLAISRLHCDWKKMYEFVRDEISYENYFGFCKSARLTLLERSGNDFDQARLLVSLLRAAEIPARYLYGTVSIPSSSATDWFGVSRGGIAGAIFAAEGRPGADIISKSTNAVKKLYEEHIWVECYIEERGKWVSLDPSFGALIDQSRSEVKLPDMDELWKCKTDEEMKNVIGELSDSLELSTFMKKEDIEELIKVRQSGDISALRHPPRRFYDVISYISEYSKAPSKYEYRVIFRLSAAKDEAQSEPIPLSQLIGQRCTISYEPVASDDIALIERCNGLKNTPVYLLRMKPVLKIAGRDIVEGDEILPGGRSTVEIIIISPWGKKEEYLKQLVGGSYNAIAFSLKSPSRKFIKQRVDKLSKDLKHVDEIDLWQERILGETLYLTAMTFLMQASEISSLREKYLGIVDINTPPAIVMTTISPLIYHPAQRFSLNGYELSMDVLRNEHLPVSISGNDASCTNFTLASGLTASALEHSILEQIYGKDAISTVKLLAEADNVKAEILRGNLLLFPSTRITYLDWWGSGGLIMGAPSKAYQVLLVKVQPGQRLATSPTPNLTFREVTN